MEVNWWRVPGATRFVDTIFQELRSGKNVVASFPRHVPGGFREALAERVREIDVWRWRTINAAEFPSGGVAALLEGLHKRFVAARQASDVCSALTLAQRLVGTIVWVEDAAEHAWDTWTAFLDQYQHACQSCDLLDRSLFCLSAVGNPTPPPRADAALAVWRWQGRVDRLDMNLYIDRVLSSRFPHPLHHQVALSVVTELAGADAQLCQHLATQDLATIMAPFQCLKDFAVARGWTTASCEQPNWAEGTIDRVNGASMVHSAAIAARGDRVELRRRVWRGQVSVLYPFIEQQRINIIPLIRGYLRLPVETTYGKVDDAEDLEVGQLLYFLRGNRIPPRLWKLLSLLTEMRHALAHLQTVPLASLLADEILHLEE